METITIEIINKKALSALHDLELKKLIRLKKESSDEHIVSSDLITYRGAMSKQDKEEIENQLKQLRSEWD